MTADAVAAKSGVASSTYREWENGRAISGQPYIKLAEVLGVSLYALFGLNETERGEIYSRLMQIEKILVEVKSLI